MPKYFAFLFSILIGLPTNAATIDQILGASAGSRDGQDRMGNKCNLSIKPPPQPLGNYYDIIVRAPAAGDIYWFRGQFPFPSSNEWKIDAPNSKLTYSFSGSNGDVIFDFDPSTQKISDFLWRPANSYSFDCYLK